MPEPLSTTRQTNFFPSAERLSSSDNQSFAHHIQTLYQLEAPNANIYLALSSQLPVSNLIETFHASSKQIDLWLEYANIAIFALELDVREGTNVKSVGEMDVLIHKFAPNIDLLQELSQSIFNNLKVPNDEEKRKDIQDSLDRINADWVDTKAFFGRVKKEMSESKQRRELLDTMDLILASIEELNTSIFEYQEQRLSGENGNDLFHFPKLSSSPTNKPSNFISNNSHNEFSSRSDVALMQLDSRLEPLSARIEYLRSRLSAPNAPSDPNGALAKKNNILSSKWDALKHEMESLREELKEDRWLGVFKQVTGNAGQMMDSLERAVRQCKDFIARAISRVDSPLPLRMLQQNKAITYKNYQRLYKTFDAKRKYYVPTVTKMLTMLANGINQQMTKDRDAIKKYKSMKD
ncbi:15103_t:CDS:2, partial [Racocetra persica]